MKKKLLPAVTALVCAIVCAFGLAACGGKEPAEPYKLKFTLNTDGESYSVKFDEDYFFSGPSAGGDFDIVIPSVYQDKPVTVIEDRAFAGFTQYRSMIIPDSVTTIGYRAFCINNMTSVTIGKNVKTIGEEAFSNSVSLTSLTIPDSVTSIDYGAFQVCYNLTSLTIGSGVTSLGDSLFAGCELLTSINFKGTTEKWNTLANGDKLFCPSDLTVHCTDGDIIVKAPIYDN